MVQTIVVALLVAGCFGYALWTLAPKKPRSRLAAALLKMPLPSVLHKPLTAAARQQGGCGCHGCDRVTAPRAVAVPLAEQPLLFQPRVRSVLRAKREGNQ
jgi:hypothetical protein